MASSYGSVTVGTSPTLIVAQNPRRQSVTIVNASITDGYIGMDSSVSTSNGLPLYGNQSRDSDRSGGTTQWLGDIYGIVSSGSIDVRYWEVER